MTKAAQRRQREMKAALAYFGTTRAQWCEARGIDESHFSRVLSGDRTSLTLTAKMDAYIAQFKKKLVGRSPCAAHGAPVTPPTPKAPQSIAA